MTHDGSGVGKINGYPIFVANTLPGEKATVKVIKVKKNFAVGRRVNLIEASPHRVKPPCNVFYKCGGCQLQHMSSEMQLQTKQNKEQNAVKRIANIEHVKDERD